MKKKYRNYSSDIVYDMPLPSVEGEKSKQFMAVIEYQIPRRILLHGRRKTSPKFDTLYGMIYWLNKQPYNMEYTVYRLDKNIVVKEGMKKLGEDIV